MNITALSAKSKLVSGKSLAHRKLSAAQRAFLARDLIDGRVAVRPSIVGAARMVGVSVNYVHAALRADDQAREAVEGGYVPLIAHRRPVALPAPAVARLISNA